MTPKGGHQTYDTVVPRLGPGDYDPMSAMAKRMNLPLCGEGGCTRAAGHDESNLDHPAAHHVAVDGGGLVLAVAS